MTDPRSGTGGRRLLAGVVRQRRRHAPEVAALVPADVPDRLVDQPAQYIVLRVDLKRWKIRPRHIPIRVCKPAPVEPGIRAVCHLESPVVRAFRILLGGRLIEALLYLRSLSRWKR